LKIVNGWLDEAIEVDVLENSMSRYGYLPTHLVMHGTAGGSDAEALGAYFQSTIGGPNPASSHIIIDQAGKIVQCVSFDVAAWGNGGLLNPRFPFPTGVNPNFYTISIEHVKSATDNSNELTEAQAQASFRVAQVICMTYGIPMRPGDATGGIISHADLDSVNRARCPGPYPWDRLWAFLQKGVNNVGIPANWKDDGITLIAPNGHKVVRGFRDWILQHGAATLGLPLEDEHAANPVEDYYAQNPAGGTRQLFNSGELAWTSARGVYVVGVGNELRGACIDRDKARADLKAAKDQLQQTQAKLLALTTQNTTLQSQLNQLQAAAPHALELQTTMSQIKTLANKF
jgi:hypothetical protein